MMHDAENAEPNAGAAAASVRRANPFKAADRIAFPPMVRTLLLALCLCAGAPLLRAHALL